MILGVMETIQKAWNIIAPYLTGITIGGIVSALFYAIFSGSIKAFINRINIDKVVNDTIDSTMNKVKGLTINVELEPLVADKLNDIETHINNELDSVLKTTTKKVNMLIECVGKLATYFDNSIAIPEETKKELHELVDKALEIDKPKQETVIEVKPVIVEKKKSKNIIKTNVR